MDKKATLGFVLIGLVLLAWMWLQAPPPAEHAPLPNQDRAASEAAADSPRSSKRVPAEEQLPPAPPASGTATREPLGGVFAGRTTGQEKVLIIQTDKYTAELSTRGGLLRKWELQDYLTWNKFPVQLVDFERGGDLSLLFTTLDGKLVNTRDIYFESDYPAWKTVELKDSATFRATMTVPLGADRFLEKTYTFAANAYSFVTEFRFHGMDSVISNYEYQIIWEHGLPYAEHNSVDESGFAMAYAYSGGELTEVEASTPGEDVKQDFTGMTDWVATRNKYFLLAMMTEGVKSEGAYIEGHPRKLSDGGLKEEYALALKMPFRGGREERAAVRVYLGPLEYDTVKEYGRGLEQTMALGAAWIIRPIAEYVMIPVFKFLRWFIPNYGVVIIVFSILLKFALHPLTRTSMKSMRKMQALNPLMTEIREKYKDEPQKMNEHVMKLYKEYGVNPASGCLPILLQMPILFALYAVFRSSIELRQSAFVWWIDDLSIPDVIAKLPFTIPLFGITDISGLAVAMGVTMFIQQKMTVTDPRQKAMVWMMPIMMVLLFNSLPSGLNLYYFVFNLLSIVQQMWFNRQHKDEPLRKVDPKKDSGGWIGKIAKDMPKLRR